jgi:hypothetical protein
MQTNEKETVITSIEQLVNICYPVNVKNGFWEKPISNGLRFGLICGEAIGEALEAHRKGKPRADRNGYDNALARKNSGHLPAYIFEKFIKDSIEDEIADAAVRIADAIGGLKLDQDSTKAGACFMEAEFTDGVDKHPRELGNLLMLFNFQTCIAYFSKCENSRAFYLGAALEVLYQIAGVLKFNLDWHILEKVKYNASRPRLHGKQ